MKQIIQSYRNGKVDLTEVPEPACKAGGLLVRTAASLISPGTEKLMIEMGRKSLLGKARARPDLVRLAWAKARKEGFLSVFQEALHRLDEPVPLGYSAAGVVLEVGSGVQGFQPGDRVAAAGAGFACHAEVLWVPENLCAPLPAGVTFEAAAFAMLGGIALHGVRQANLTLGERAVVIGLGLLGLLSVQLLKAQGCRVMGIDLDRPRGELGRILGADLVLTPGRDKVEEAVANFTGGLGADAVLITAASQDSGPLRLAEAVARERGRLVLVGVAELQLSRKAFWEKELSFTVSKAAGPGSLAHRYEVKGLDYPPAQVRWTERRNLEVFLDLLAQGRVQVDRLITHRFPIAQALQAYDLILENREPYIGVVIQYPPAEGVVSPAPTSGRTVFFKPPPPAVQPADRLALGLIGGGMFARNILLPALKKLKGPRLVGVATTTGVTAQHLARKFGFAYATTDCEQIFADPDIGSVIITTRHNSHAPLVLKALAAGKHVLVEKPLCLTFEELDQLVAAYDGSQVLMVGFNRRFAPLAQRLKEALQGRTTPLTMCYRVNAGYLPADHWVHDPEVGGGRLRGEVCHFIDFFHYLTGSEAVQVGVTEISGAVGKYRPDDNISVTLTFRDGSLGTILYTAQGPKAFSRERLEVFWEDNAAMIEDFRRSQLVRGGRMQSWKKFSMDLGYLGELEAFFFPDLNILRREKLWLSCLASTRSTLGAFESLHTKRSVPIL